MILLLLTDLQMIPLNQVKVLLYAYVKPHSLLAMIKSPPPPNNSKLFLPKKKRKKERKIGRKRRRKTRQINILAYIFPEIGGVTRLWYNRG
jgi:hypothetical protein